MGPHTHYNRSVFEPTLLHKRNDKKVGGCKDMRWRIKAGIEAHLTEDWLQRNVSGSDGDYLHHHESCLMENFQPWTSKCMLKITW